MNDEMQQALIEMGQELLTQNNRMTSHPVYMVQVEDRVYGVEEAYTDLRIWRAADDVEEVADEARAESLDRISQDDPYSPFLDEWVWVGYTVRWEDVTPFFTRKAAQNYIDANNHNLNNPRIYVKSGSWNYEWQLMRQLMIELTQEVLEAAEAVSN